jgi:uncharacterized iron-regulated membrane protein
MVWRWHFYSGLLVSPVILVLAGSGALLIFQDRQDGRADERECGMVSTVEDLEPPLHAGSVAGTPTQVVWLLGCLGLMLLPVTGVWMWWQ